MKAKRLPTVSIGLPVYNGGEYLREAIDLLLAQSFSDFELIISDNASTDSTSDICKEYAKKDARICYILQQENIGALANFRFVLSKLNGKYFMWAAHDDRWDPRFLEMTVAELDKDDGCNLVFCNYIVRDLVSGKETMQAVVPSNSNSKTANYITRTLNMCPSLIYGLFRVSSIQKIKFTTSFDFADVHFVAEIALSGRIKVLKDCLYVAGTKGSRDPYSCTHKKINRKIFLHKQYQLLKKYFHFPISQGLFLLVCLVMAYNKIKLWKY